MDWTDTNWTHALGTERLTKIRDALEVLEFTGDLLAHALEEEAAADLVARSAWWANPTDQRPWWPLTDLERAQL
jgi:hypothetical protein